MRKKRILSVILCVLLTFTTLAMSACGSAKQSGDNPSDLSIAFAARYETPITNWDPSIIYDTGNQIMANFYETLLRYDGTTDEFIPILATDYEKSEDGLVWTFHLREGVKFHDGTEFNADAVKFSIDRTMAGKLGSAYIWDPVESVNVIDDYTVEFKLVKLVAFDFIVASASAAFIMSPTFVKKAGDEFDAQTKMFSEGVACGTGPYMLQSQIPNDEVVATRFDDYWGGWDGEHFDKVVFKLVPEDASRRQMLESGEADVVTSLMVEDVEALKENPDIEIVVSDGYTSMIGYLNTQKPPLDNVKVRQALAYAFPYEDVVEHVKKGYANVATGIVPNIMWGAMENTPYTHDLEKAKALLEEAGYPDGGFDLVYTYGSGREDRKKTAELFKGELAKVGITLDIQAMPWDSQWAMAHDPDPNSRQDIFSTLYWSDVISPFDQLYALAGTMENIDWNISYYSNPEVDTLIQEAGELSATDREGAIKVFREAGKIIQDDCAFIPEGDQKSIMLLNKTFKGYSPNPAYIDTVFFYDCYREK